MSTHFAEEMVLKSRLLALSRAFRALRRASRRAVSVIVDMMQDIAGPVRNVVFSVGSV